MEKTPKQPEFNEDSSLPDTGDSLEYGDNTITPSVTTDTPSSTGQPGSTISPKQPDNLSTVNNVVIEPGDKSDKSTPPGRLRRLKEHFNIYLLVFVLLVIIAVVATTIIYINSNKANTSAVNATIDQQNLPAETLQELAANGVQVGDPKQVLNIQSNAVFAGTVLVKGELQIAGGLKIGSGSLTLPEVTVGGTANINQLQTQTLDVSGNTRLNSLSVNNGLSVNGNGTFNGGVTTPQLSVGRLQLNGDLSITRHLIAGGATPGRSNGGLGNGGTSSVSGSDTAGSISINTGGGATAGCMVTVNFANAYGSTPHVIITPVGSGAAGLSYYINRSANNFSVCTTTAPPSNSSFGFDYHVFE